MIVILKNIDDLVEAHAYLLVDNVGNLDNECASHKSNKISPNIYPDTVRADRKKSVLTVGDKDSELMEDTFKFESRHVPHYGDITLWLSENQRRYIHPGQKVFIWMKDTKNHVVSYVFHLDRFLMDPETKPCRKFMKCTQRGEVTIWSISLERDDKLLHEPKFLNKYDMN